MIASQVYDNITHFCEISKLTSGADGVIFRYMKLFTIMRKFLLILPGYPCPVCGGDQETGFNSFCGDCVTGLPLISSPRCPGCGGRLDTPLDLCGKCMRMHRRKLWAGATSVLEFRGTARALILQFKNGRPELARPLGELCRAYLDRDVIDHPGDFIAVPVPLHWRRKLTRGYNQSEFFARCLFRGTGVKVVNALSRTRYAGHQASRGRRQRIAAMKGIFALRDPETVKGRKILLVDDVFTTGSTLSAAAEALLKGGPAEIRVFTIARR